MYSPQWQFPGYKLFHSFTDSLLCGCAIQLQLSYSENLHRIENKLFDLTEKQTFFVERKSFWSHFLCDFQVNKYGCSN